MANERVQDYDWEKALADKNLDLEPDFGDAPDLGSGAEAAAAKKIGHKNMDMLLDIPMEITAELGRAKMIINDLLQLGQGSVIELNKLAGEPLEIMINQKLIARGEVVVVNEKFGIRLTDIISPLERIKQLS